MTALAFFSQADDVVTITMRADDGGNVVGDMSRELSSGDEWHGLTYAALVAAGGGTIEFADDGSATIVPATTKKEGA